MNWACWEDQLVVVVVEHLGETRAVGTTKQLRMEE